MGNLVRKSLHRRMNKIGIHMGCRCCNTPGSWVPGFNGRVRTAFKRFQDREIEQALDDRDQQEADAAFELQWLVESIALEAGVCRDEVEVTLNTDSMKPADLCWNVRVTHPDGSHTGIQGGTPSGALRGLLQAVKSGMRGEQ